MAVTTAARLDRILVSDTPLRFISTAKILGGVPSDHRIAIAHLSPAAPHKIGTGLSRVRLHFIGFPDLLQSFTSFLSATFRQAPDNDAELLLWWPQIKLSLLREAAHVNRVSSPR